MKIGTFAKKFNLNISTVRFYVNTGLLTPNKVGSQYEFNEECVDDMKKILEYKQCHFSLEEIELLFFMRKTSNFQDKIVLDICRNILKNKRNQLITEKDNLVHFIEEIDKEIADLPTCTPADTADEGVPFAIIPYLYCPDCQKPLKLDFASLANNGIQKGVLSCLCGYTATITDGIILCRDYTEDSPLKAYENIESVTAWKEHFSSTYRMLMKKTYIWMYNQIANQLDKTSYILAGPFTYNFILEYIEKLAQDNILIIFDPSLKRINKIRQYIPTYNKNIVYIAGSPKELPIKNGTVDIFIDDYSTTNSLYTYNAFSTEYIGPLLKESADVTGIFNNYQHAPNMIQNFKKLHPNFEPEKMNLSKLKYQWSLWDVAITKEKRIGTTTVESDKINYTQNAAGEMLDVYGYHANKGFHKET